MGRNSDPLSGLSVGRDEEDSLWPSTKTLVLEKASKGDWSAFLQHYLKPCCREIRLRFRSQGTRAADQDDLLQELMVRLMQTGPFSSKVQTELRKRYTDFGFSGNMAARYLKFRELPLRSGRFRAYLKGTIQNLVYEALRVRVPIKETGAQEGQLDPAISESISWALDRRWIMDCIGEAAEQLRKESESASTVGPRELFRILYLGFVEGYSRDQMAVAIGRDRSVASRRWKQARTRFIELLQNLSGIKDESELRDLVLSVPGALAEAFRSAAETRP